jgi:hypothetical protein
MIVRTAWIALALTALATPAQAVQVATVDFNSLSAPGSVPASHGSTGFVTFDWDEALTWPNGATSAADVSIYWSGVGSGLDLTLTSAGVIDSITFDYFTYFDSAITGSPNSTSYVLLDASNAVVQSGTFLAPGGAFNTDKPIQSFTLNTQSLAQTQLTLRLVNDTAVGFDNFSVAVPEPAPLALLATGLGLMALARRRRA